MSKRNLIPTSRQETPAIAGGVLQRKCACGQHARGGRCDECRKRRPPEALPVVEEALRSSGDPLAAGVRGFMERRIGHDFSHVRIHTGERAARSARAVDALAYTVGRDVVFGAGQYAPEAPAGRRLIAHELTHVVQQGGGNAGGGASSSAGDLAEREADGVARAVAGGELSRPRLSAVSGGLQRAPAKDGSPPGARDRSLLAGDPLPYREATELLKCVRIMGKGSEAYCRQQVLGEVDDPLSAALEPEAGEPAEKEKAEPDRKVVLQPAERMIAPEDLERARGKKEGSEPEPWKITPKTGAEGKTSRQLHTGSRESSESAVAGVEAAKEGAVSLGAEVKGEHAKESAPGKKTEATRSVEIAAEAKIPVGSWIFDPKKLKRWVILKEVGLEVSFATKRPLGPDPKALRILAGELTVDAIGWELKSEKVDLALGLSGLVKLEGEKGPEGWKKSLEMGGKAGANLQWRPKGGSFFIFIDGTAKLTTTQEGHGKFQPGTFTFTLLGGLGWQIGLPRKRARR